MHHTKEKGDLGVLKAQLDMFEQGFVILNPVTEHAPFDLVAYKDGYSNGYRLNTNQSTGRTVLRFISVHAGRIKMERSCGRSIKQKLISIASIVLIRMSVITWTQRNIEVRLH